MLKTFVIKVMKMQDFNPYLKRHDQKYFSYHKFSLTYFQRLSVTNPTN